MARRHYEDTETRRRQVAEAALRTLAEDGVAGFTTRAVASRVGISDGTLFRHFGNKEEIVLEAMALLEAAIQSGMTHTADPLADLEHFYRHRAAFVGSRGSVGRLIFSDGLLHLAGEKGREKVAHWRASSVRYLLDKLQQLAETGRARSDIPVAQMSTLIQGSLLTFAIQAALGRSGTEAELQARIDDGWSTLHTLLFSP